MRHDDVFDALTLKKILTEEVRFRVEARIPKSHFRRPAMADVKVALGMAAQFLVGELEWSLHGTRQEQSREVTVPETWWDHLKLRWAPRWALRRWPVRYQTIAQRVTIYHLCPHLDLGPERHEHVFFLAENLEGHPR